ncbi:hypothetical protein BAUCODRAFT_84004 [Baudoinia panamericana UAMH 10762]|uniref:Nucleoporin Pom152 n=1 Tax=Baudoinia panamericana (strain UAMH 10762) TaxID=717646 RepID=M2LZV7_BAUPA|nr:uncharacterized protein BAUCODRAFT_84004 [Baudoinia panamericana UAMH 10762]EMD00253.1 hypothetical protein BAUCODRAFT_84004 [Baudoinia panamericana UAMH 10762]
MEGTPRTPRLGSAWPATPQTDRRSGRLGESAGIQRVTERLPELPSLRPTFSSSPPGEPLVPEHILDAPSQRLWAVAIWVLLWSWKAYDFTTLQDLEEQSLWLFMKWVALDGIFLFGLPTMRIPWLEWSSMTMILLFFAHAFADGMMMFRIPIPVAAGFAILGRSIFGASEIAIAERSVNPRSIEFNESLILGRQIIHILPEGSAVLNAEKETFCIDGTTRVDAKLPITINSTNPISMDLLRIDLETDASETIRISKSQIRTMHKDASRLKSYSEKPNEPKTLYYTVRKPGIYSLTKVVDESNLEVARKRIEHTVVVPCPKAAIRPMTTDRCKGDLSSIELEVTGTPPMRVRYRKTVNQQAQEATFESIQPEEFVSPLTKSERQHALALPGHLDPAWVRPQKVRVPLSEGMTTAGKWVYAISEVIDGFGNKVSYSEKDHDSQEKHGSKSPSLHQVITVHERPLVNLKGCSPQNPLKVAKGSTAQLPVQLGSTGKGPIADIPYHLEYIFSPQSGISATGEHSVDAQKANFKIKDSSQRPTIQEAGLYTIVGVSTDYCGGEVLEPASCLLQNPPEPELKITKEEIFDKCAGSPIGLRVDLDLVGTPPFEVSYRVVKDRQSHHTSATERVTGQRGQIELTPREAGSYEYEFYQISDAVYKNRPLKDLKLNQSVKPAASARFIGSEGTRSACIDETAKFNVGFTGEEPFTLEYEIVHNGKRANYALTDIKSKRLALATEHLHEGGDYTIALISVTDKMGCKEFLKGETKISVRHQKPRVAFGQIDGRRTLDTLEGKSVELPLRLSGEAPWTVALRDQAGKTHDIAANTPNDQIKVSAAGIYELLSVKDASCPGQVDDQANTFEIKTVPRPEVRVPEDQVAAHSGNKLVKTEVCEGEDDAIEVLFKGSPPFSLYYVEHIKPDHGVTAPKNKELRAAVNVATLRMNTAQAGLHEYEFSKLEDANYDHSKEHFTPITVQQRVNPRPSVAFANPGKTYSYCSVESAGEEVIPITLHGKPPFDVELEIKQLAGGKPELIRLSDIMEHKHNVKIPHSRVQLGRSAMSLRRVSDSRGCSRLLDSTTPRVQISVHDAPTITPLESHDDVCVGDHVSFALSGQAPFDVYYEFEGKKRKAVATGTTFRRLAEKPGTFTVTGVEDNASSCHSAANITRRIHGMPSVRVSGGRESYVDIHEGSETEILFTFGGVPPFEFTYTRSSNTEKGGKKRGVVLDMRHEVSEEYSMRIKAGEEGTYEVVAIKDRYCAYAKPGINLQWKEGQKRLGFH